MYHVLIAGAGYTGLRIASYFHEKKQKVWTLTRSKEKAALLEPQGMRPVVCDITRPETLADLPPAHFIVIGVAPDERSDEAYRKIYLEGAANLLSRIRQNPRPNLIVYLSSTGVYGEKSGASVDETTPPGPDHERGKILLEAEEQILNCGLPSTVFRLGGIYGPQRNSAAKIVEKKTPGETDSWINMIHVEDIAGAMPVLFNKAKTGEVYLGVDDEPVLRSEFETWIRKRSGLPPLAPTGEIISGKRCRNEKLKALGYSLKHPTFREGYERIGESLTE